ncbi:LysR family transcriptional regulator [Pseudomonas sp. FFUP_PS_473]|uniref:LysR family transcriptional regulator n=1 Tax=unclassified Pseudomonas TaxID=196821 RepID=UPI000C1851D2|nr:MULTISPECIES: LysR family transcriptional regulator [unclassified Pseudomonas]ATR83489.1 LysR family transcriptional regulator [Pseudomonas sp. HLS-6]MEE3635837.1 LysR family transcriptional regulator [Pseudomonas sp. AL 58]PLP96108.1 LysR family transcriptional regulator [Pseudomonas sp. FFUP_PS_473]
MLADELPNLMQVRAFVRVAELGSVSKASEAVYRAQSVVTRAIAELEARLEVPLFERHVNGMRLTDYGARVLPRARRVLAELETVPRLLEGAAGKAVEPLYLFQARRLQVFVKLCETCHMQTVARHFGLSQPAVSAALKVLEGGCGQSLFERTPRGLQPTRASHEIVFPIRRALNELRHIQADITAMRGTLQGVVHVGALPLGRTRILPDAIVRLTAAHPGIRVITNESPFDLLATELRAGDVDFILGALRSADYASDLVGEALLTEEMVILARRDHPLCSVPVGREALSEAHWVLPRAGSPARQLLDAWFTDSGLAVPWPVVESGDLAIIRGLLLRSDMLAIVSAHQLEQDIASGALCILPVQLKQTTRAIGLTYRSGCLHSPAAQVMMTIIRQAIREQVDG